MRLRTTAIALLCYALSSVAVADIDKGVNAIRQRGQTNSPGDGIITVSDALEAIRIRTGEMGSDALT